VTKKRWRNDHPRVITSLKNFKIGAASEGGLDFDTDIARFQWEGGGVFHSNIFFSIQNGCTHGNTLPSEHGIDQGFKTGGFVFHSGCCSNPAVKYRLLAGRGNNPERLEMNVLHFRIALADTID